MSALAVSSFLPEASRLEGNAVEETALVDESKSQLETCRIPSDLLRSVALQEISAKQQLIRS